MHGKTAIAAARCKAPAPPMLRERARRPWGALSLLAVAVAAAHLGLLQAAPSRAPANAGTGVLQVAVHPAPAEAGANESAPPRPAPHPRSTLPTPAARPQSLAQAAPSPLAPAAAAATPAAREPGATHAAAGARAVLPPSLRLHYTLAGQARGFPLSGRGELVWRHDGHQYEARLDLSSLLASRSQQSTGRVTAGGLVPERYGERTRSEEAAHFDWEARRITFSGNRPDQPLQPGAQDRLSVLLQVGALLAGDATLRRPGQVIAMQTASTRDADTWQFSVEAQEELSLPGGHATAWRLQRLPRKEFDQKVEVWIAPAQDFLPVRVRLTQPSGDWLDQQWTGTDRN